MTSIQPLLIAFASTDGLNVDGHFGSCAQFYIYRIDADGYQKIEVREASSERGIEKNAQRAQAIADCHLLFCESIGGPAAARVIRSGIYPMKCKVSNTGPATIEAQLLLLQTRIQSDSLPPWLRKLTGQADALNHHFQALS